MTGFRGILLRVPRKVIAESPQKKRVRVEDRLPSVTTVPHPIGSAPRGQENTTQFEMRYRRILAAEFLEQGLNGRGVVRRLMLPPQPVGAKDSEGRPIPGGLGLTKRQATRAKNQALRKIDAEWEQLRGFDRVSQVMQLDAAIQGAMRERKWGAVSSLANVRAKITGTYAPLEVLINPTDERRRALQDVVGKMSDVDLAELLDEDEEDLRPVPRQLDA